MLIDRLFNSSEENHWTLKSALMMHTLIHNLLSVANIYHIFQTHKQLFVFL